MGGHAGETALSRRLDRLDEDDVRTRPPRSSRPRTRRRPAHGDAEAGTVTAVDRGRYTCLTDDAHPVVAMKARELGRNSVVVGDHVGLVGDLSGGHDALARIVRVEPRASELRRTADDTDPVERVIVANAEQLGIVIAVADPPPRPRLVDRCLVAAYDAGLEPFLCVTKTDLGEPTELLASYAPLLVTTVTIGLPASMRGGDASDDASLDPLRERLAGRTSVLVGHSGVGKSTLVNALVPRATRATGEVNAVTGRGRHTSTSAVALPLPGGGWVIDTPGVRSFGLGHVPPERVLAAFPDLAPGTEDCPRGCSHMGGMGGECALDAWVADGHADPARLDSLRRLLASREGE